MNEIRGISLWQPWASLWAIQAKKYETRSWATSYRGPIAIHSAKKDPYEALKGVSTDIRAAMLVALREAGLSPIGKAFKDLPLGAIIATADLVGCHKMVRHGGRGMSYYGSGWLETDQGVYEPDEEELLFGDWTPGRFAWEVANVKLLDKPVPYKGAQGLWRIPNAEEILKGVL